MPATTDDVRRQPGVAAKTTARQRIQAHRAIAPSRRTKASQTPTPRAMNCQPVHCQFAGSSIRSGASIAEISAPKKRTKRPTSVTVRKIDEAIPQRQAQPAEASQARTSNKEAPARG